MSSVDLHNESLANVQQLRSMLDIDDDLLDAVQRYGKIAIPQLPQFLDAFYAWMAHQPDYRTFFSDPERLQRVKGGQLRYWQGFFRAQVDDNYLRRLRDVGEVHARIGLPLPTYFAAMDVSLAMLLENFYDNSLPPDDYIRCARAVTRLVHFDTTAVVETYSHLLGRRMAEQTRSLIAMSTPVTSLWEGILLLPIIGLVDSRRAQDIMHSSLSRIAESRAKVFIIDISGVSVVDTAVANHLIKVVQASQLMGCVCILSGLSPAIAQTIVELGIPVNDLRTTSTLRNALEIAFKFAGVSVKQISDN
ncbi:rsbT co-antagonist protein RsbR [Paucibacter oligotrophus]|uniref:RsbT co-antagonist protein RsbR n=1 Tax=Roseateles oligotrophus TaxID=1769250 RepID=A0A840L9I7_9BURK|nr:protoglobin domain-containing protein [Roseateles oligotrophus]MBB4845244.1 rsbT co-antagonist protein RsbR [Roseateles oligotrophus]